MQVGSASKTELAPQRVDARLHRRIHRNRPAPCAGSLTCPFVRRVDTHLAAKARHGRREIEIVDRRMLDDQRIARGVDPARDTLIVEHTPIDYLDFASPVAGLGSKMGIDATNKWAGETTRAWGRPIAMDSAVKARVDALWGELGL